MRGRWIYQPRPRFFPVFDIRCQVSEGVHMLAGIEELLAMYESMALHVETVYDPQVSEPYQTRVRNYS